MRSASVHRCVALVLLAGCQTTALTPDAGGRCDLTNDRASVSVQLAGGQVLSCAGIGGPDAGTGVRTFTGRITGSDATSLVMDECGADAGCVAGSVRLEIRAPGLDLVGFPHRWVLVKIQLARFYACQQSLEITTVDPTDGSPAQGPAGQLLLAVVDGGGPFDGSPYKIDRVPLGCRAEKGCGFVPPDEYAFDFSETAAARPALRVSMGETKTWAASGGSFQVRNLRSYQSTLCDDYWNFAYTLYADPK
jgi:hypothetical protein